MSDGKLETIGITVGFVTAFLCLTFFMRDCARHEAENNANESANKRACIAAGGDVIDGNCIRRAK